MNNRFNLILYLICISSALLIISGCGSNGTNSGDPVTSEQNAIGFVECYICHADGVLARFVDRNIFSTWQNGPHGNNESIDEAHQHVDLHPDNPGFPYYGYSGIGVDPSCTLECHDQLGDGMLIEDFYIQEGNEYLGRVNRPLIACESCHGGGEEHFGIKPVEYPIPDPSRCAQCHNDKFPDGHLQYHPEGDRIIEDYLVSPHAHSINEHNYVDENETDVRARCSRCHTDEGARVYTAFVTGTESRSELMNLIDDKEDIENATPVQCKTCHDAHDPHKLLGDKIEGLPDTWSSEFKTCTACHQLLKLDGSLNTEAYHDPSVNTFGNLDEIITDTHYAKPGDFSGERGVNIADIAGYSMDFSSERVCRNCHNQHIADNTRNRQWAESGHAEKTALGAWAHYNWSGRADCQRCHTTSGVIAFTDANRTGTDYSAPLEEDPLWKPEMLQCRGCHSDNTGKIRNPGPITTEYTNAPYTYPDIDESNICMACHTARESGESINNSTDNFSDKGFINSHYLTAGGTLFTVTGYEFSGSDYSNNSFYQHNQIGVNAFTGTGTRGPCIGCHLSSPEKHLFLPVKRDENGNITTLTSTICVNCHSGDFVFTAESLNEIKNSLHEALEALEVQLENSGYTFLGGYPYFANRDWTSVADPSGRNNMGAAFNFNLLEHDPGAYAHNSFYTKRLIYDSIDWLDDNKLNDSVAVTLDSALHSGTDYQEGAKSYILSASSGRS